MAAIESAHPRGRPTPTAAEAFYTAAFGLGDLVRVRASEAPTSGFRGFTVSLVVSAAEHRRQPGRHAPSPPAPRR